MLHRNVSTRRHHLQSPRRGCNSRSGNRSFPSARQVNRCSSEQNKKSILEAPRLTVMERITPRFVHDHSVCRPESTSTMMPNLGMQRNRGAPCSLYRSNPWLWGGTKAKKGASNLGRLPPIERPHNEIVGDRRLGGNKGSEIRQLHFALRIGLP